MVVAISIKSNVEEVRRRTQAAARQIPFATSVAINETLKDARAALMKGMEADLQSPTPFTVQGIRYERSTKANLTGRVYVEAKRAEYLRYQVFGGRRLPRRKVLIIGLAEQNQYGNTPGFRRFRARLLAKRNHFEATINGTSGIWERVGRKRKGGSFRLRALYTKSADYERRFRFFERGQAVVRQRFPHHFEAALARAIATAKLT